MIRRDRLLQEAVPFYCGGPAIARGARPNAPRAMRTAKSFFRNMDFFLGKGVSHETPEWKGDTYRCGYLGGGADIHRLRHEPRQGSAHGAGSPDRRPRPER